MPPDLAYSCRNRESAPLPASVGAILRFSPPVARAPSASKSRTVLCGGSRSRPTWRESSPHLRAAAEPHRASRVRQQTPPRTGVESRARAALPMAGVQNQGFQDGEVDSALQPGDAVIPVFLGSHSTQVFTPLGRMSTQTGKPIQNEAVCLSCNKWIQPCRSHSELPRPSLVRALCRRMMPLPEYAFSRRQICTRAPGESGKSDCTFRDGPR